MTPLKMVVATQQAQAQVMLVWHEWIDAAIMAAGAAGGDADQAAMQCLLALGVVRMTSNLPDELQAVSLASAVRCSPSGPD